ncbi:hypothetical protein [Zoogloea sp.]|uniref:hypothetical protein n=1 Tax=Zoogloea sp. TaxID=49181 RepID=UPI0035AEB15B
MARVHEVDGVKSCREEAAAIREGALLCPDDAIRVRANKGADRLESLAASEERKRKANEGGVLVLAEDATNQTVSRERSRQAVRRGRDVYLPLRREGAVLLPNILLRSALFSANNNAGEELVNEPIASLGQKNELTFTGPRLGCYDRRVLAACLQYYGAGVPLCPEGGEGQWIKVTFWELARSIRCSYGTTVHIAIRNSLKRLHKAQLRARFDGWGIPQLRLLEVAFDDGEDGLENSTRSPKGSDVVAFRIGASMAKLFGLNVWTAVNLSVAHDYSGLASWLANFYSTHAKPYTLTLSYLYELCGVVCSLPEFKRRLKNALTRLQKDDVPDGCRVGCFELDNESLTVTLVRWGSK